VQPHDKTSLSNILDTGAIAHNFSAAAATYDAHACFQQEAAVRLVERLDWFKLAPVNILDLGSGTGLLTELLKKRYPKANIIGVDIALSMNTVARKKHEAKFWERQKYHFICGDAHKLPLKPNSFDLVISNCTLQWCDPLQTFQAIKKVLKPNGLCLFTTLGIDTLKELRASFEGVDNYPHVHPFIDMHLIGDMLVQSGFIDPVMDMEQLTVTYPSLKALCWDLKKTGATNLHQTRASGLMSRQKWQQLITEYAQFLTPDKQYPATFEIIYGHAFHPARIATQVQTQCTT
jgi:malonyl-CoA O-methyltransferase